MKRREFFGLAAAAVALPACARAAEAASAAALSRPRLLRILRDPRAIARLGRGYRALTPAEDDQRVLVDAISAGLRAARAVDADACAQDDFAAGRTVIVGGWVLARTEARQCALYSILAA